MDLPRGTVSFLFTDFEGSTRLWRELPVAMSAACARHDAILRDVITARGGVIYKTVEAGMQAAFASAGLAVSAAVTAQLAMQTEPWAAHGLPEALRIRMAIHAGAVDPDPDGDYRSPVLNRLGRLLSAAHGGQVLLSAAVHELILEALPAAVGLLDLGEHRLRDLEQPSHIYQVLHPELPEQFPPIKTPENQPNNLPSQLTAFLGRADEIAAVQELMRREDIRLLTLTGPGGTGKTRLSLHVARRLLAEFPDGAWFVQLAPITDPALVPAAIAEVLQVREAGATPLPELLIAELADSQALLVLDNFEQVTAAARIVAGLLAGCPRLKVLATSRVALHLRAEREFPVAPLALPRRYPPPTLEQLTQYGAVQLFIDRAQAVRPDFAVDNTTAPAVSEICHRLDGLPLAIELAAARVRLLSPEAMLARLEKRLPLLVGGAKDLPDRQRTLRQTIAWSYDLMPPEDQLLFRDLSVFCGGFTLEAAESVAAAAGGDPFAVLDGLERLVGQSLLRRIDGTEPRFGMLETIREFGLEQLSGSGNAECAVRRAHAALYSDLVIAAKRELATGAPRSVAQVAAERDNVRATLNWLLDAGETETALRMTASLSDYWLFTGGQFGEGRVWLERALAQDDHTAPVARAGALNGLASMALHQRDAPTALTAAMEALTLARAAEDPDATLYALFNLSSAYGAEDRYRDAVPLAREAVQLARWKSDPEWLSWSLYLLGKQSYLSGELPPARAALEEAIALSRQHNFPWSEMDATTVLGLVLADLGELARAARLHAEALAARRAKGAGIGVPEGLFGLADISLKSGEPAAAAWSLGAAAAYFARFGYVWSASFSIRAADIERVARQQLGDEHFMRANTNGQSMPIEEALAEAMALAERLATLEHLLLSA